jgi:hypothetical protein
MYRKIRNLLSVAAIAALAVLGASSTAHASDNANGAGIYQNNFQCNGASNLATQTGFVNIHEDGDQVTVIVHLKDAPPNNKIFFFAYSGFCTFDASLGTVDTNSNGVGNATFTYKTNTPGGQVFLVGYDTAPYTGYFFDTSAVTP